MTRSRRCQCIAGLSALLFLFFGCIRNFRIIEHNLVVPNNGFPGYENLQIHDGSLRFDGAYCRKTQDGDDVMVNYRRFWPDGSVIHWANFYPHSQDVPELSIEDADNLAGGYVGKFKYSDDERTVSTCVFTPGPNSWANLMVEYQCDDGGQILTVVSTNSHLREIGEKWYFVELKGLRSQPMW